MAASGGASATNTVSDIVPPRYASTATHASLKGSGVRAHDEVQVDGDSPPSSLCKCRKNNLPHKSLYTLACPRAMGKEKQTIKRHSQPRAFIVPGVDVGPYLRIIASKIFRLVSLRAAVFDLPIIIQHILPCVLDLVALLAHNTNIDDESEETATFVTRTLTLRDTGFIFTLLNFERFDSLKMTAGGGLKRGANGDVAAVIAPLVLVSQYNKTTGFCTLVVKINTAQLVRESDFNLPSKSRARTSTSPTFAQSRLKSKTSSPRRSQWSCCVCTTSCRLAMR